MTYLAFGIILILVIALIRQHRKHQEAANVWSLSQKAALTDSDKLESAHKREIQRLLDSLPELYVSINQDRKIIRYNSEVAALFENRDLKNRSIQQIILEPSLISLIEEATQSGTSISRTLQFAAHSVFSKTQSPTHWSIEIKPISLQSNQSEIQLLMREITASVVADQVRQDFVANASHELRTPLSIIAGYLENLNEDGALEQKTTAQSMLATMNRHVERINRIVEDMLLISKLESKDSAPISFEDFDLSNCVNDIIERLHLIITTQHAEVVNDVPTMKISGDPFYWTQLLVNLVENALKQNTSAPVKIKITAEQDEQTTTISVSDNGIGIPKKDLPFIFKRFYRVEKHHSQNQIKGTGLGLSIVKRAVESHQGSISVTSTPGVETRFKIQVPNNPELIGREGY